jgi:hypothetical protein
MQADEDQARQDEFRGLVSDYDYIVNLVNTTQPSISSLKETVTSLQPNEKKLYLYFQLLTWVNMLHAVAKLHLRTQTDRIRSLDRNTNIVDLEPKLDKLKDDFICMIEAIRLP